jgi:superfamily I DNA and RNA helicase
LNYIRITDLRDATARAADYRAQIADWAAGAPEHYESSCFDYIFVDEGQDFEPEEFRLLLDLIKPHPATSEKPIVIFYDDAQNLYGRSRPVWREIGINVVGERAQVMKECFRNTRPIVELAFNVLLGSAAPPEERALTRTYADIAYLKERGLVEENGDLIEVRFAERRGDPPRVNQFSGENDEMRWVAQQIARLVCDEGVRREDILVLFSGPKVFDHARLESLITASIPDIEFVRPFAKQDIDQYIFQPGKLTISTVAGAKGYDAPIVFIVGANRFGTDIEGRAAFYVAATRAKMFLQITGVESGNSLLEEAAAISAKLPAFERAAA